VAEAPATLRAPHRAAPEAPPAAPPVPERLEYQPALDGLRALAVIAVMVFHNSAGVGLGRGGFLGVDVFFVLSGFLITSLLLVDHARTGRVLTLGFWARRARRLVPAMLVLLLIQAVVAIVLADPWELHTIRNGSLATVFYASNYWQLAGHPTAPNFVLGHTWSLSIEEQFYLVWPVLLAAALYLARRRTAVVVGIITVVIAASTAIMFRQFSPANPFPAYSRIDSRAHSLLVGAVLAFLLLRREPLPRRWMRIALEIVGIAALVVLVVLSVTTDFFVAHWLFRGGYLAIAVVSAVLIAAATQPASPVLGRALSWKPLVWIGLISYGLYLFHIPVFKVLNSSRAGIDGFALFVVRVLVVLAIAIASYFIVERPVRRGALTKRRLFVVAPVVTALLVTGFVAATVAGRSMTSDERARLAYERTASFAPDGSARVLVLGNDATAFGLGTVPNGRYSRDDVYGTTMSLYGCSIVSGAGLDSQRALCAGWPRHYRNAVEGFDPDVAVLSLSSYEVVDRVEDGRRLVVGTPEFEAHMLGQLDLARQALTVRGAPMVLLTAPCGTNPDHADLVNSVLRRFAAEHPGSVRLADYGAFMCSGGAPRPTVDGGPAYESNGISLSPYGVMATWQWLAEQPAISDVVRQRNTDR
jgi:peptidoglycan/LPS O-acetylase OafA/YrhL